MCGLDAGGATDSWCRKSTGMGGRCEPGMEWLGSWTTAAGRSLRPARVYVIRLGLVELCLEQGRLGLGIVELRLQLGRLGLGLDKVRLGLGHLNIQVLDFGP